MNAISMGKFRGFEIYYMELASKFKAEIGESSIEDPTLVGLKEKIENQIKKENEFKRIPAYMKDSYHRRFRHGHITSIAFHSSVVGTELWFVSDDKKRRKESKRYFFADNEHNRTVIDKIESLKKECARLEKEQIELVRTLDPIEIDIKYPVK